ncbi:glycoside hydrolase family 2 TIM barrel-domain containing protein [Hymenobacter saemangeumensis]|uniref:Glycoside hydrolase family 2 TIM barrel-domain containing protein n=1 Tax=Hymenobacter saemangeumensis TaxID=1084522 RepID=A0ABP8HX36_9BACT
MIYLPLLPRLFLLACLLGCGLLSACRPTPEAVADTVQPLQPESGVVPVQVVKTDKGYALQRDGKPYFIKGAAGVQKLNLIREKGGNSVRIYTATYADVLLDEAQRNGLTVMFGLWMKPPYEKFDYYDPKAVAEQQAEVYRQVMRFKNHPALLMWNLGNELDNHNGDFKVYQIVNETARMIHKLDPNHPVTTTITDGTYSIPSIAHLCTDLDVLTINVFTKLAEQPQRIAEAGWKGPYIIGEFGGRGWWESPLTSWDAPLDQSGTAKAEFLRNGYVSTIAGHPSHCLGAYVLYWGNRFEQTDMWLSLFAPTGEKTPMVDMIEKLWTTKKPANEAPRVGPILLNNKLDTHDVALAPGAAYPASITATDPEGDSLRVEWRVTRDVDEFHTLPQNRTAPEPIPGAIDQARGLTAVVRTPTARGAYRLLVNVYDGKGSVSNNSFPFFVGRPDHPEKGIHMPTYRRN